MLAREAAESKSQRSLRRPLRLALEVLLVARRREVHEDDPGHDGERDQVAEEEAAVSAWSCQRSTDLITPYASSTTDRTTPSTTPNAPWIKDKKNWRSAPPADLVTHVDDAGEHVDDRLDQARDGTADGHAGEIGACRLRDS